jgi:hypothetical protein
MHVDIGPCRGAGSRSQARSDPWGGRNLPVAGACWTGGVCWVVGDDDAAFPRGVIAPGAGIVGAAELVVCGVKKAPEHHWVRHAEEVPFRVPMKVGGWQCVKGAQGRFVAHRGTRVPGDEDVTARGTLRIVVLTLAL